MINLPPYPKAPENNWKGLTLDEILMRRALVQARMEIQKYKLNGQIEQLRSSSTLLGGGGGSFFSRITSAFSFAEYAFMAVKLFRLLAPVFRKKK